MALDTAKATVTLRDLTRKFDNRVDSYVPFWPSVCTEIQSDGSDEKYGFLGSMPGTREWEGDRQFKELRGATFTIPNRHWENSLLIKKTDIADDRMALYGPVMEELATEAAAHPDELVIETLIAAGHTTACWDGQYFFDTDHVWGDSGSQDNDLTATAASGTTPTAAEFKTAYNAARVAMIKFKNDQGKFLNRASIRENSNILVVVPPDLQQQAYEGLTAALSGGGDSNIVIDRPTIVTLPQLTDAAVFYTFNMGGALRPFVFQKREALSRGMKGLDDIETKDVKFMTEARYAAGYLAWWTAVRTQFT